MTKGEAFFPEGKIPETNATLEEFLSELGIAIGEEHKRVVNQMVGPATAAELAGRADALKAAQERAEERRAVLQKRVEDYLAALANLEALGTHALIARTMALHRPAMRGRFGAVCEGCDAEGYEVELPDWPCRTAALFS